MTRKAVQLYADHTPPWSQYADGLLGRKLAALVRTSRLEIVDVRSHVTLSFRYLPGEMGYERATKELAPLLSSDEANRWLDDFEEMEKTHAFFASKNAYVVRARHRLTS